ncbi:MAG: hypothetical protein ACKPEN_00880, partial [Planktothrix sp.]|uniref:hypothetical protein n=1 Tax=Planktothrix sp. TaxID=3088171 RepID=UPI0038D36C2A
MNEFQAHRIRENNSTNIVFNLFNIHPSFNNQPEIAITFNPDQPFVSAVTETRKGDTTTTNTGILSTPLLPRPLETIVEPPTPVIPQPQPPITPPPTLPPSPSPTPTTPTPTTPTPTPTTPTPTTPTPTPTTPNPTTTTPNPITAPLV